MQTSRFQTSSCKLQTSSCAFSDFETIPRNRRFACKPELGFLVKRQAAEGHTTPRAQPVAGAGSPKTACCYRKGWVSEIYGTWCGGVQRGHFHIIVFCLQLLLNTNVKMIPRKCPTLKIKGIPFSFYISIKYISCMHIHMFSQTYIWFQLSQEFLIYVLLLPLYLDR